MAEQGSGGVPEAYRQGAEEVREHLVSLRGGAPFLSPADAIQLVHWFDGGVSVGEILRALERAHAARRKSRSRIPLGLRQAKRHLGRPAVAGRAASLSSVALEVRPEDGPLAPLVALVRLKAAGDPHAAELEQLAASLASLDDPDPDTLVRRALGEIRELREAVWERAPACHKEAAREASKEDLADLLPQLDEATALALIEEEARERVRAPYGWLDAASVWDVVEAL